MNSLNRFDSYAESIKKAERAKERKIKRKAKALELGHKKKVKKIPKAKLRKRLIKALDKEFSLWIRSLYPCCVFHGHPVTTEHCFHFVTRAKHSVRWNRLNAVGSCAGCNYRYEFDPHFAITWFIGNRGLKVYEGLIAEGNKIAKFSNEELKAKLDEIVEFRRLNQKT